MDVYFYLWKDQMIRLGTGRIEYNLTYKGKEVFSGVAVGRPDTNVAYVKVNDLVLSAFRNMPFPTINKRSGWESYFEDGNAPVFVLSANGSSINLHPVYDWSYNRNAPDASEGRALSLPLRKDGVTDLDYRQVVTFGKWNEGGGSIAIEYGGNYPISTRDVGNGYLDLRGLPYKSKLYARLTGAVIKGTPIDIRLDSGLVSESPLGYYTVLTEIPVGKDVMGTLSFTYAERTSAKEGAFLVNKSKNNSITFVQAVFKNEFSVVGYSEVAVIGYVDGKIEDIAKECVYTPQGGVTSYRQIGQNESKWKRMEETLYGFSVPVDISMPIGLGKITEIDILSDSREYTIVSGKPHFVSVSNRPTLYRTTGEDVRSTGMKIINTNSDLKYGDSSSSTRVYKVVRSCCDYVLHYLNEIGGWDSMLMNGVSIPSQDYDRKKIITNDSNDSPHASGEKTYFVGITQCWELHRGNMTDNEGMNVRQVFGSPKCVLEDLNADGGNRFIPVEIDSDRCEERSFKTNGHQMVGISIVVKASQGRMRR